MTVNRTATQAGKRYEKDLLNYLRARGHETERLRLSGSEDEGDLVMNTGWGRYIIEAKRCKRTDLAGWVKEAQVEMRNYVEHRSGLLLNPTWVVIHHARGKNISQSYVTTTLEEWLGKQ